MRVQKAEPADDTIEASGAPTIQPATGKRRQTSPAGPRRKLGVCICFSGSSVEVSAIIFLDQIKEMMTAPLSKDMRVSS